MPHLIASIEQRSVRTLLYVVLLTTLAFPVAEFILINQTIQAQKDTGEYINDSGRQRMLSQRIALLGEHLVEQTDPAAQVDIRRNLTSAIDDMASAQERLAQSVITQEDGSRLEARLYQHYYQPVTGVNDQVKAYLDHARALLALPPDQLDHDGPDVRMLRAVAPETLLATLEEATALHRQHAKEHTTQLYEVTRMVFTLSVAALLIMTFFVFRPLLQRMYRSIGQVQLLQSVAMAANQSSDIEEALLATIKGVCTLTGWPVGHAYVYNAELNALTSSRIWDYPFEARYQTFREASDDIRFAPGQGLIGQVYTKRKPSWIADISVEASYLRRDQAMAAGLVTAFAFPIVIGGEVIAVLEFYGNRPEQPQPQFYEAMASIGQMLGQVVERSKAAEESQLLKTVITSANDGVIITKANLDIPGPEIIYVNAAFTAISGYQADDVIGQSPRFLQGPETNRETLAAIRTALNQGQTFKGELLNYRNDGTPYWLEISIVPVRNSYGWITHYTAIERDITERKAAEARYLATMEQLKIANLRAEAVTRDLEESLRSAEQHNQAKSDFLANMSHELRTPMNGVIGMAQLLAETPLSDEQHNYVRTIGHSAEALLTLLNDILDISKIEAGVLEIERIAFSPRQVAHNVQSLLSPLAQQKGIEFICDFEDELPEFIWGDPNRFRQIITNLLSNAIKFTQQGHVRLALRKYEDGTSDILQCRVEDTGIGIPESKRTQIFEKFVQADATVTRKFGGTGLGLTITRELIAMMGGTIGVESMEGKGSTFWFNMPYTLATESDVLVSESLDQLTLAIPVQRKPITSARALLVEDYPVNQIFAKKILQKLGFATVELAENGIEAITKYQMDDFDIVFMDCQMPQLDGYQATQEIRDIETKSGKYTPIVAMTANAMVGDREKCLKAGMDEYLSKPLKPERLNAVLAKWFVVSERADTKTGEATTVATSDTAQPVIDLAQLRNFTNGDPEEERQLIQLFMEKADEGINQLKASLADNDHDAWRSTAHRLKGAAGNFGAATLQHYFKRAETRATDPADKKHELLSLVGQEMRKIQDFVREQMQG